MTTDNSQTILKLRTGQEIILPQRKDLLGGLKFTRRFSHNEVHPYDEVDWTRRDVRIMDWKTGKTIYERLGLEAPAHWDDNAVKITADKYLFGSEPGSLEYEDSFRNIYDRISNTYTVWGWEEGYFATLEDAEIFNEEIKAMLVQQIWAPNSPVWFNIGHWEQWRWGRPDLRENYTGHGNKAYHTKGTKNNLKTFMVQSTYEYPQCSACFLTEVGDSMEDILDHLTTEGRIFASGSGVGINLSTLRSSKEPISGKGRSSGPISFDRGWDRMAGAHQIRGQDAPRRTHGPDVQRPPGYFRIHQYEKPPGRHRQGYPARTQRACGAQADCGDQAGCRHSGGKGRRPRHSFPSPGHPEQF